MWIADGDAHVRTLIADHLDLAAELIAIGAELSRIERQHGPHALIDDARRRQRRMHDVVRMQMRVLLMRPETTIQ